MNLDDLFSFPVLLIDREREEYKASVSNPSRSAPQLDIVRGIAEHPYYDFLSVEDSWSPLDGSFEGAVEGDFDACEVRFKYSEPVTVPWTRTKFKSELRKFIANRNSQTTFTTPS